jgi:hypothetical protein
MSGHGSGHEEPAATWAFGIVRSSQSTLTKALEQLLGREQSELMDLDDVFDARSSADQVFEAEAREPIVDFDVTHASDTDGPGFRRLDRQTPRLERPGREPWLDQHDATVGQVRPKPPQRSPNVLQRPDIPDGAEQTQDHIVVLRQLERGHIGLMYRAAAQLPASQAHECRIQVDTIDLEAVLLREQPGVLAGATRNVEHRSRSGVQTANGGDKLRDFGRVVLEPGVDQIVELSRGRKHECAGGKSAAAERRNRTAWFTCRREIDDDWLGGRVAQRSASRTAHDTARPFAP